MKNCNRYLRHRSRQMSVMNIQSQSHRHRDENFAVVKFPDSATDLHGAGSHPRNTCNTKMEAPSTLLVYDIYG